MGDQPEPTLAEITSWFSRLARTLRAIDDPDAHARAAWHEAAARRVEELGGERREEDVRRDERAAARAYLNEWSRRKLEQGHLDEAALLAVAGGMLLIGTHIDAAPPAEKPSEGAGEEGR